MILTNKKEKRISTKLMSTILGYKYVVDGNVYSVFNPKIITQNNIHENVIFTIAKNNIPVKNVVFDMDVYFYTDAAFPQRLYEGRGLTFNITHVYKAEYRVVDNGMLNDKQVYEMFKNIINRFIQKQNEVQ